jgi:hypothetical protein
MENYHKPKGGGMLPVILFVGCVVVLLLAAKMLV